LDRRKEEKKMDHPDIQGKHRGRSAESLWKVQTAGTPLHTIIWVGKEE